MALWSGRVGKGYGDAIRRVGQDARMTRQWRPSVMDKALELADELGRCLKRPRHLTRLADLRFDNA